ncbi:ABC transporter type 1, transmembrane domain-containing protein [Lobosporangium transversale]|uniref:ABC transporter type 1, transmembrane domain-containing protein n=1 Tax=Lobosporangium transversale TaxID=64571 RepID=A0A1Y2GHV5_9FUNG|nr:ABC transporter type 1, transmembrane domain-containing protein [Lobosporangium transversale]ORZ07986.1 ABC transporter type 1, transmembrane domain-containing protein [Lobosporangium transversale]|eukprot:XP_021878220.1 ABC transporter type 1, transmembrane domain-containing protein [Lobosporangium transversale]
MGVAWIFATILNIQEHKYEIRTSTLIFCYYVISTVAGAITTRTLSALPTTFYGSRSFEEQQSKEQEEGFTSGTATGTSTTNALYYTYFGFILFGLFVMSWPRGSTKVQKQSDKSPYEKASIFSRFWFHYLQGLITLGYKRPLQKGDIQGMMPQQIRTEFSYKRLSQQWEEHVASKRAKGKEPWLLFLVVKAFGVQWIPVIIYIILSAGLRFIAPELMDQLLRFIESYSTETPKSASLGVILAFGMFFSTILSAILEGQFTQLVMNMGIETRTALVSMVYRKALKLSPAAKQSQTPGEINNHMSVDAERWSDALPLLPMWFSIPLEICIALWLLYRQLGWAALGSLATIIAVAPLQGWIANFFSVAKDQKLEAMDNRIRLTSELMSSIKIVKLYGWESSFLSKVSHYRNRELGILRKMGVTFSFMTITFSSLTLLMALVSFSIYATVGGPGGTPGVINSQNVFVSITLFGFLNRPIGMLSHVTSETISLIVATRRIQTYLLEEELPNDQTERLEANSTADPSQPAIEIKNGTFAWVREGPAVETEKQIKIRQKKGARNRKQAIAEAKKAGLPKPTFEESAEPSYEATLKHINLAVQKGHLAAIVGRVAQGKSSLIDAIIGNMYKRQGTVKIYGQLAYVPQQAWIINATLRDNILFGSEFDQEKYDRVIYAAGLTPDIEMLPAGDQTEIGERGINLSGGQKQRVSLARAAYQDADIYLLDDPLSAVDAHVDHHLWRNLIGPNGLLKDKTRLLITHGIHHLSEMDQIVVMKDGQISEIGKYQELMDSAKAFFQLIQEFSIKESGKDAKDDLSEVETVQEPDIGASNATNHHKMSPETKDEKLDDNAALVEEERMKVGSIQWHVFWTYAKAASYFYVCQILFLFIIIQACQIGTNTWLQYWVRDNQTHSIGYYMGIYAILVVTFMLLIVWTSYTTMVTAGIRAGERLHNRLLTNVLRLPMSFFDTTPVGRIINRFSSDCFSIDEQIPWAFHDTFFCFVSTVGSIIVIAVTTPIFLVIIPPIIVIFIFLQRYYIASSRNFRRIESVTKSPMYQHFAETLSGVSTIRALQCNERFIEQNASRSDQAANARFVWSVGNRWLNVRLEGLGSIIVLAASMFAVFGRETLNPSMVGMSLAYALNVTMDICWMVRCMCEVQFEMVAVERIDEYCKKNQEAPNYTDVQLEKSWPTHGHVEFKNYSTRYRQGMDLVLRNVSFEVQPGEKVGIVGRTGAGKSSLTLALFRIVEAANSHWAKASHNGTDMDTDPSLSDMTKANIELEKVEVEEDGGAIWIDGVDISTVGLEYLRRHLAIIPQDPTLFVGTIRENLDPFQEASDAELWEALERAHLKDYVSSMPGGLSYEVTQNGENFSVGQRSLICLARALLRKTKILILDEATAAVDVETDELIQRTIRQEFKDRTILTIAHRIKTVMDSDKILVLEKGRVQEYDAPSALLKKKESLFYRLAEQAGEIL